MHAETDKVQVLVTGASGLIGTALVDELRASGRYAVAALSRGDADLRDLPATRRAFEAARPEVVFHLAARVAGLGGNLAAPGAMLYENLLINSTVIEAARSAGVRKVIAAGSAAIYSDGVSLPMKEEDLWLGPPHASEAPYGHAKRTMLAQLEAYQTQYGLDYAFAILTNTYGPNDRFDEAHGHVVPSLISKLHRAVERREPVVLWGSGTARRDFLYSKDVARALRLTAERWTGPINIASGGAVSIAELAEHVARVSGYSGPVEWDRSKPNGQEQRAYSVNKLAGLGFRPEFSLEAGLRETYDWFVRHAETVRR